ncbi:hypothetical protein DH2020_019344 [Rehmannia glutinosa]|uniref:Disease resistance protein n=1 Tax=Rehmannia glutinosa TaxID=99300 RepID=A0ABR0WLR4_REHGL
MAELAISATLVLLEIVPPLLKKLHLREDVQKEIVRLRDWLSLMKAFMEDNYGREGSSRILDHQVDKVRNIAYEIEDVIEEFILHSPPYTFHNHFITRKVHNLAHNVRHGFPLFGISEKIASIMRDIDDFKSQNSAFSANNNSNPRPSSSSSKIRNGLPASPLLLDDEMVGYEKPKKEFIRDLVDGDERLVRLAVAGPAGSGKTTFVKNVFWKRGIWGQFDCHAWVLVSRNFDLEELFVNMLKQFCSSRKEPYPPDDGSNTLTKLHKYLYGKRYVVVLDDICKKEDWDAIKDALPNAFCKSRIIVTTSSSDVASICASSSHHMYSLNGLEWLEGLKLFCTNAFPDINGECPYELKECCVKIVTKCDGLPHAIVAIGRALAQKPRNLNDWEKFHNSLEYEIRTDPNLFVVKNSLLPSYMDLSSNLKSCFLYFSIFPEDSSVERGRLVKLWVAEGFAIGTDGQTAEEVAEDYLNQLIHMNLVHVSKWDFDGRPRCCHVQNLVLNFLIQKCKDEGFASIFSSKEKNTSHQSWKIRRLSVHNDYSILPRDTDFGGGIRSMFLLRLLKISAVDLEKNMCKLMLLRILDFQGAPLTKFPENITRLAILKYLNLSDTKIKVIPTSIKKLFYLETLYLKQTDVTLLPKEISHLHNLRHLLAYKYNVENYVTFDSAQCVEMLCDEGIDKLTNLQKFSLVKVDEKGQILQALEKMTQLRKLGLTGLQWDHGTELSASVGLMKNLKTLDLCSTTKQEYLQLGDMSYLPQTLERLYLKGRLEQFPASISSLHKLQKIGLKWSKLYYSPLKALQCLPNLIELELVDCCIEKELIFEASCFKKLKILLIEELVNVNMIVIHDGAMPDLRQISLRRCPKLMMCPLGIHKLAKVEELILYDMPEELVARLRENSTEDHFMVKHIHVIHSFTLNNNQSWAFENLSHSFSQ